VRLLLDTQVAIWTVVDPDRLSDATRSIVADFDNEVFVSAVSIWEIASKFALQKRHGAPPFSGGAAIGHFRDAGYEFLTVTPEHVVAIETLPTLHAADPFDRLLIAQALQEPMRLVTADEILERYSDTIIRA
jgi:PIN domain nuclease of toxin-antitoxin system